MKSEIFFIPVKDPHSKLAKIAELAALYVRKKEKLLILVPDEAALHFVDQLLWRFPEESFLPHQAPEDLVLISQKMINNPSAILNLCPSPCFLEAKIIYELEDFTTPDKEKLSKERYQAYRNGNYTIYQK